MATAYIEYDPAPEDVPYCKPTLEPTKTYQFAECLICNQTYIAEPNSVNFKLGWYRVEKWSRASQMLKRAKRHAAGN